MTQVAAATGRNDFYTTLGQRRAAAFLETINGQPTAAQIALLENQLSLYARMDASIYTVAMQMLNQRLTELYFRRDIERLDRIRAAQRTILPS